MAASGLILAVVACGTGRRAYEPASDAGSEAGGEAFRAAPLAGPECSEPTKYVYVVSTTNQLLRFDAEARSFSPVTGLACDADGVVYSLAIDRFGIAWVNYVDGSVHRASIVDGTCQKVGRFVPEGFKTAGVAFATDPSDKTNESLFAVGCEQGATHGDDTGYGLLRGSVEGDVYHAKGDVLTGLGAECGHLTGTGDGRLFGFFVNREIEMAQIDKATGALSGRLRVPVTVLGEHYTFAFWGGDFYFFTAPQGRSTSVTRYQASTDGAFTNLIDDVGFRVVAAAVSTCAPVVVR